MANITLKPQAGVWFFAEKLIINKATFNNTSEGIACSLMYMYKTAEILLNNIIKLS